jgi:hypothetical protein
MEHSVPLPNAHHAPAQRFIPRNSLGSIVSPSLASR